MSDGEMPFLDHLEELRWRIIWSLVAVVVCVGLGFFLVVKYQVIALLEAPVLPYLKGHNLVATDPTDGLQLTMSAGADVALLLAPLLVLSGRRASYVR